MKLLIPFALINFVLAEYDAPTVHEYNKMLDDITTHLRSNPKHIPKVARLASHDCVGSASGGCINIDNESNNVLSEVIDWLGGLYDNNYDGIVSRADFWQIAAIAAIAGVEKEISVNNRNCSTDGCTVSTDHGITFYWGRDDRSTSLTISETFTPPEHTMTRTGLAEYDAPTVHEYNLMLNDIKNQLLSNLHYLPLVVRLAFHDCIGNACNACINHDLEANYGLSGVIDWLESLYHNIHDTVVSRADFWQIAAIAGIESAVTLNNKHCSFSGCTVSDNPNITFYWGRKDCSTSPMTSKKDTFPRASMTRNEMMDFFHDSFGFNEDQVTAILGAHTLGGAKKKSSGYSGIWVNGEKYWWNNRFYTQMIDDRVTYTNTPKWPKSSIDKKWQWDMTINTYKITYVGFRLSTDVELCYDIDVSTFNGTSCTPGVNCKVVDTYTTVEKYANSYDDWMADFVPLYEAMTAHGYTDLEPVA